LPLWRVRPAAPVRQRAKRPLVFRHNFPLTLRISTLLFLSLVASGKASTASGYSGHSTSTVRRRASPRSLRTGRSCVRVRRADQEEHGQSHGNRACSDDPRWDVAAHASPYQTLCGASSLRGSGRLLEHGSHGNTGNRAAHEPPCAWVDGAWAPALGGPTRRLRRGFAEVERWSSLPCV